MPDLVLTWRLLAAAYPEFTSWVVQTQGPLPEGPVEEKEYERLRAMYYTARNG
jgi:hypothetical protein